ncbi:hypothetical protein DICPUDRAFT_155112 [Dictyostelium purpureum]|uniref:Uncharacterized protein n=1 Tax=Dictyostelium purpureum TaxID=5786 RepID=F0ZT38_DICPU|nr:uncharacterized protein DICPUDRAFT_155112 [Dictyostelium purpureum]EGC32891.1 hypothetical protein DICPUDRAFT_155112 [Dictyostelium purpureum]|eukprot:XP_003290576.1 hypothetical protein DICPUDRAFT_155112 [Dictyostelium purpureum]
MAIFRKNNITKIVSTSNQTGFKKYSAASPSQSYGFQNNRVSIWPFHHNDRPIIVYPPKGS